MVDKPIFEFIGEVRGLPKRQKKPGIPINLINPQTRGYYLLSGAEKGAGEEDAANQYANLNFTGTPGTASGLYYSLVFEMGRLGFKIEKAEEWIDVSPTHRAYWEKTTATKQMLEGVIKQGLASAASLVSDHELAKHDIRKYEEVLKYFAAPPGKQHSLRAMFVDNVDAHTDLPGGGAVSLRTSVQRWPTLISDFMKLQDTDIESDVIAKKYNLSRAESVILSTKNRLFVAWKEMFKEAAKDRYTTLTAMVRSREKSISEYKEWLRPYIARYKLTKTGSGTGTLRSFVDIAGQANFFNYIRLFAWKPLLATEPRRAPSETVKGLHGQDWWIYPYDDWIRYNYVLNSTRGLAAIYPWLMEPKKFCSNCNKYYPANKLRCDNCGGFGLEDRFYGDQIMENEVLAKWNSFGFKPEDLYYYFIDMKIERAGSSLPIGEIEDITFALKGHVASQNVMAIKALELRCREIELEHYIDEMLGFKSEQKSIDDIVKEKLPEVFDENKKEATPVEVFAGEVQKISKILGLQGERKGPATPGKNLMLLKPGPYERDMEERITKQYLSPAGSQFGSVVGFLKSKMGVR